MSAQLMGSLLSTFGLLVIGYSVGTVLERRHLRRLEARERDLAGFPSATFQVLPEGLLAHRGALVTGSVVISVDYFKRLLAFLRSLVGGRIRAYESLLDRARREALVRMLEEARAQGFDAVINVRLETSRLASAGGGQRNATSGVEMLASGTAVTFAAGP